MNSSVFFVIVLCVFQNVGFVFPCPFRAIYYPQDSYGGNQNFMPAQHIIAHALWKTFYKKNGKYFRFRMEFNININKFAYQNAPQNIRWNYEHC